MTTQDLDERASVWKATDDKSDKMRRIRQSFLKGDAVLSDSERLDLMALTTGLERANWVLHEFLGGLIAEDERETAAPVELEDNA